MRQVLGGNEPSDAARFRPMTTDDLDGVARLNASALPFSWSRRAFFEALHAGYECWVAELRRERIGHGVLATVADEAHLLIVCIDPALHGRGFGSALTRHLLQRAAALGASAVFLEARCSNRAAIALYAKLGFRCCGRRRDYYPTASGREDAVLMTLPLTTSSDTELRSKLKRIPTGCA